MFDNTDTEEDQEKHPPEIEEEALSILETAHSTGEITIGTNEVTKAVERDEAELVYIAEDVHPVEIVQHIPKLCDGKGVPYLFISEQQSIGNAGGLQVGSTSAAILDPGDASDRILELTAENDLESKRRLIRQKSSKRKRGPKFPRKESPFRGSRRGERLKEMKEDDIKDTVIEDDTIFDDDEEPESVTAKVIEIQQRFPEGENGGQARCQILNGPEEGFVISTKVDGTTKKGDHIKIVDPEEYTIADDWSGITANGIYVSTYELSGVNFNGAVLSDATFQNSDLSHSSFIDANLSNSELAGSDLPGAKFTGADLSSANLADCNLQGIDLSGADLTDANLSNTDLSGATLRNAVLSEAILDGTVLRDVELSGAGLASAELSEIDIVDLSKSLMRSSEGLTKGNGADIAELAIVQNPECSKKLVNPLIELLSDVTIPSVQISALRSLKKVAKESSLPSSKTDSILSSLLRQGTEPVREVVAVEMSSIVIRTPNEYPETINALWRALDDDQSKVQIASAKSLAVISYEEDTAISDLSRLKQDLQRLATQPGIPQEKIGEAIGVVAAVENKGAMG